MRGKSLGCLVVCLLGLVAVLPLKAQITTTVLFGNVTDQKGGAVVGANVTATNTATNFSKTTKTNDRGEYRIEFLPVGNYQLEIIADGFKKFVQKDIVLEVRQNAQVDAGLQVGGVSEIVEVTAGAALVNTSNAEIGRTVENKEIVGLPIVNRNLYTLLDLVPGVQSNANSIVLGYPEQRTMINGGVDGGAGSVNYYLDGGNNMTGLRNTGNILPNPDAVQEFRVQTNNYSAEFGRFSGGVINVITKSGTNAFHGSLFEFVRNTIFNANTYANIITPTNPKAPLHRNQFGGTVGGPIIKNKTFFFFSYAGLRQITPNFLNGATVPTTAERTGDFSADNPSPKASTDPQPIDPLTGKTFVCNGAVGVICANRLDPTAVNILSKMIPPANVGTNGWQGSLATPFNTNDFLIKLDHQLTGKQMLTVSYFETSGINTIQAGTGNLPWSSQRFNWRQHNANISDTWTLSPNKVNQVWLTYTRNFGGRLNLPQTSLGSLGSSFLIQGTPSLPQISVTGFFSLTQAIAGPLAGTNFYSLRDVFSYTHGRHSLEFGGEFALNKDIQATLLNNYGVFTFSRASFCTGTIAAPPLATSCNALADFLLGLPSAVAQDAPVTPLTNTWNTALFVQDNFRALPRLTFNIGLRWDIQTPATDPQNRESTFVAGQQSMIHPSAPKGILFPGDPGVTRGIIPVRYGHISPRAGLAWDPFGDGKTSLRAGAGIFWGSTSGNNWNMTSNFEPFAIRLNPFANAGIVTVGGVKMQGATLTSPYQNYPGGAPFPYNGNFVAGGSIFGIAPNFDLPYTYHVDVALERQIAKDFSISIAFVGAYSHNLPFAVDLNYPTPCLLLSPVPSGCGASGTSVLSRRPIDNSNIGTTASAFGQVFAAQSGQTAAYNGLQVTATKKMARHFMLNAFYTYSKSLDSVELQNNTPNPSAAGQVPQNYNNLKLERGRSDFDIRQQFVAAGIWELDYYGGPNSIVRGFVNGWRISPIVKVHTGLPFTVTSGVDNNQDGSSANDRPNLVPGISPVMDPYRLRSALVAAWFNTQAFTPNTISASNPSGVGNAARNLLDAPGYRDVDLAIYRDIRVHENWILQVRAEATNAFNMVSLGTPNTTLTSASFGKITSAQPMRQIQLGMRLTF
jgi:hypothetical protein